jgi:hypothetical protein
MTDLVTGKAESKLGVVCSTLNNGNCPHFKDKQPICVKCVHVDRKTLGAVETQCKAKWDPSETDPVTGDPVKKITFCKYANQHFGCQKFVEAPEGQPYDMAPALIELKEPIVSGVTEMAVDEKPEEKLVLKRLHHIHWMLYIIMLAAIYFCTVDFGKAIIDFYFMGGK